MACWFESTLRLKLNRNIRFVINTHKRGAGGGVNRCEILAKTTFYIYYVIIIIHNMYIYYILANKCINSMCN